MKDQWRKILSGLMLCGMIHFSAWGDPPNPPPPPGGHGLNGNQPAGAPLDTGAGLLLAAGALYGGRIIAKKLSGK
jgi:hypothetical protein